SLVPVISVQAGADVTVACTLPDDTFSIQKVHWSKQSAGATLKSIVTLWKNVNPVYGAGFSPSKVKAAFNERNSTLTILRTSTEDEGMYHCAVIEYTAVTWSGTYLSLKGNTQRTTNYTVVQHSGEMDPIGSGNSKTLQCSVLSVSQNQTCSEDLSVFWFRAASDESHPHIIYSDGNRAAKCNQKADTQRRCVHHFSKNISSSEVGTYYCAVATCGEILFGDGTKADPEKIQFKWLATISLCFCISVMTNIFFICYKTPKAACVKSEGENDLNYAALHFSGAKYTRGRKKELKTEESCEGENDLNYAALHFSGAKYTRGRKKELKTEESVYSDIKI
ncbi:unnamed protein product, partial [Menidia menidia]